MRRSHDSEKLFLRLALYLFSCLLMAQAAHAVANKDPHLSAQRQLFLRAEIALKEQHLATFSVLKEQLKHYPLAPYLDYQELTQRLEHFPYREVALFLDQHKDSHLADRLGQDWLQVLADAERWEDYRHYFDKIQPRGAELRCYAVQARLADNDDSALDDVAQLWNVGRSQPNACDPVFETWMKKGYLNDELAWERHSKAMAAGDLHLARYVATTMSPAYRELAELFRRVHQQPDYLSTTPLLTAQNPRTHEIALHGIRRYAVQDPLAALKLWERYDASHFFDSDERRRTTEYLIIHLVVEGHLTTAQKLLDQQETITNNELIAWLVRDALRNEDWQRVFDTILLFQPEQQVEERWLYWRARALEQLEKEDPEYGRPDELYARLALSRSYYGFLAADVIGRGYTLEDRPIALSADVLASVRDLKALQRARELFHLGRELTARREWVSATRQMDHAQLLATGKLAEEWGWYHKGIQAMIGARYWDDLQLRFPLAYAADVTAASANTQIEPALLYAIARQESAFAADARSPAGAMGLMQLLPATAKRTAKLLGLVHGPGDLVDPSHNIQLGSHYLHGLLKEFNGNRILAMAAYNAGPHRVKQWLENSERPLPYDIWIETIPYRETRGYVQNVLSYSVIYAHRMGQEWPLLNDVKEGNEELRNTTLLGVGLVDDAS